MLTPQMETALRELARLEEGILHAQANIRMLDDAGTVSTLELKNNLTQAVSAAENMKRAIEKEAVRID